MKRRDFIMTVAASAGSAYAAMKALDLLDGPATAQSSAGQGFQLQSKGGGKRVIILGAGVAGMASAYELGKAGYGSSGVMVISEANQKSKLTIWRGNYRN
jgi:monoamine oxidase